MPNSVLNTFVSKLEETKQKQEYERILKLNFKKAFVKKAYEFIKLNVNDKVEEIEKQIKEKGVNEIYKEIKIKIDGKDYVNKLKITLNDIEKIKLENIERVEVSNEIYYKKDNDIDNKHNFNR